MRSRLLTVAAFAGVLVALLPGVADAQPFSGTVCSGPPADSSTCASGGVIWYNRSVGVQGSATYHGSGCGSVTFTFYLDEQGNQPWGTGESRSVCNTTRDFNFTYGGPQGGIRLVEMCVTDPRSFVDLQHGSECTYADRSQDPSSGAQGDLPDLPAVDVGS